MSWAHVVVADPAEKPSSSGYNVSKWQCLGVPCVPTMQDPGSRMAMVRKPIGSHLWLVTILMVVDFMGVIDGYLYQRFMSMAMFCNIIIINYRVTWHLSANNGWWEWLILVMKRWMINGWLLVNDKGDPASYSYNDGNCNYSANYEIHNERYNQAFLNDLSLTACRPWAASFFWILFWILLSGSTKSNSNHACRL